jgi:hypothetical protein
MIHRRSAYALALGVLVAIVQACSGADHGPPSASRVVDRYMEAVGGKGAAARFPTRHIVAEMTMPGTATATGMRMNVEVWTAPPNRMLSRTFTGGMSILSGFDGTTAWAIADGQPRILDRSTYAEALGKVGLERSVDLAKAFPIMETLGERTIDGHDCWNVRMENAEGFAVENCFDKDSGLLVGSVVPGGNARQGDSTRVVMSEYRDFDGLQLPTRITATIGGQSMVTLLKSVSHAPIPDSVFALPPSVRALLH